VTSDCSAEAAEEIGSVDMTIEIFREETGSEYHERMVERGCLDQGPRLRVYRDGKNPRHGVYNRLTCT
jgi:hypothetical protein